MSGLELQGGRFLSVVTSALAALLFFMAQLTASAHAPHHHDDAPDKNGVCAVCSFAANHNQSVEPASPVVAPAAKVFAAAMLTAPSVAPFVISLNSLFARAPPLR